MEKGELKRRWTWRLVTTWLRFGVLNLGLKKIHCISVSFQSFWVASATEQNFEG